jgi:hypothetical protein
MDTPTTITPAASQHSKFPLTPIQRRSLAIVVLIAAVALIGYFAYRHWQGSQLVPAGQMVTIASDGLPLAAMQRIDLEDGSLVPLNTEGQGTAVVLDAAHTDAKGYYLIGDPGFSRSNLYRQDRENPGVGLEELTHSTTLKFDLAYDDLSGVAAYVSVPEAGGDGHITVWSPLTKKETDIGAGMHPVLLPGGFFVVLERDGKVMSVNVETGEAYELLSLAPDAVFAVDAQNMKLALYVPALGTIQQFSIANSVGASFESAIQAPSAPGEMAFSGGALVTGTIDAGTGELVLARGDETFRVHPPAPLPGDYKLSILHD